MSTAIKILQGAFGRVSLLDMSKPLVNHAHRQCHVLIKVSGVDSSFLVRGRSQPLMHESAVLINAWEPHSYDHTPSGVGRCILLALYLEPTWLSEILPLLSISGHPHFFPKACILLPNSARKLANALTTNMLVSQNIPADRLESKIFDLFIATVENHSSFEDYTALYESLQIGGLDPRIRRAVEHIRSNFDHGINMSDLAAESGLSRAHFFELFRRNLHVPPSVYINSLRVETAIDRLVNSLDPIAEVSYDLGFSAPGHFTRFFRQHLGITPSDYRRAVDLLRERERKQL